MANYREFLHADRTIGPVLGKDEEREESDSFEYEHGYRLNEIAGHLVSTMRR